MVVWLEIFKVRHLQKAIPKLGLSNTVTYPKLSNLEDAR